jgi:hypothetical protein
MEPNYEFKLPNGAEVITISPGPPPDFELPIWFGTIGPCVMHTAGMERIKFDDDLPEKTP